MRGTNLKNTKNHSKIIFVGAEESLIGLKSRDTKRAHLALILNLHTTFQFPSSISRGDIRKTNSKNKKFPPPKTTFERL